MTVPTPQELTTQMEVRQLDYVVVAGHNNKLAEACLDLLSSHMYTLLEGKGRIRAEGHYLVENAPRADRAWVEAAVVDRLRQKGWCWPTVEITRSSGQFCLDVAVEWP